MIRNWISFGIEVILMFFAFLAFYESKYDRSILFFVLFYVVRIHETLTTILDNQVDAVKRIRENEDE